MSKSKDECPPTLVVDDVNFTIFTKLALIGQKRSLTYHDIPIIPRSCREYLYNMFSQDRRYGQKDSKRTDGYYELQASGDKKAKALTTFWLSIRFYTLLLSNHMTTILSLNLMKLLIVLLSFLAPILLGRFVEYFDRDDKLLWKGAILLLVLLSSQTASALLSSQFNYRAARFEVAAKGALMLLVFQNTLALRIHEKIELQLLDSQILNVIQIDIDRSVETVKSLIDLWAIPLQVLIAFLLLYNQVSIAFLAGVSAIALMIPLNSFIAKKIGIVTKKLMAHKDARIAILNEALKGILGLKSAGLEKQIVLVSSKHRGKEVNYLVIRKYLDALCVVLWATMPVIVPYATFTATVFLSHEKLDSSKVLTTLALLNMLIFPMNAFPWVINGIIEGSVSAARTMRIIYDRDLCAMRGILPSERSIYRLTTAFPSHIKDVILQDVVVTWINVSEQVEGFTLGPINLRCEVRLPTIIFGSIGAGKSSLLYAILGETLPKSGEINTYGRGIAYTAQNPSLHRSSIRENILMNNEYDASRYRRVLNGCCLDEDLASGSLRLRGDQTMVATGGTNLSGGQRVRIAVARCLYSSAAVVLLDDPFAALDAKIAKQVCDFVCIYCEEENRLLILALQSTHLVDFRSFQAVRLEEGHMTSPVINSSDDKNATVPFVVRGHVSIVHTEQTVYRRNSEMEGLNLDQQEEEGVVETGQIDLKVIISYLVSIGPCMAALILLSTICMQTFAMLNGLWLAHWAENMNTISNSEFLRISTFILCLNLIAALIRSLSFAKGCLLAAIQLYDKLITSLFALPMDFFEETSFGQIFNRIGQDTNVVDDSLPFTLNIVLAQFFVVVGTISVIIYILPVILLVILLACFAYYRIQLFYRVTSRQMRRLESASKSPVYSLMEEALENGTTIRGLQAQKYFEDKFISLVDTYVSVSLMRSIGCQWLNIRLQLIGVFISTSVATFAVIFSTFNLFKISGAQLGLILVYSLAIVNNLNGLVSSFADAEQAMISVERIVGYINLSNELVNDDDKYYAGRTSVASGIKQPLLSSAELGSLESNMDAEDWPQDGSIHFSGVSMRYRPELPHVLEDFTLHISPGEKIALIGRTGSGKSSLYRVLLRLNEYSGSVVISGRELRSVSHKTVREAFTVIPQDPLIFAGDIAFNLDPGGQHTRLRLCQVLQQLDFTKAYASTATDTQQDDVGLFLSYPITAGGGNLSQGQKELLCLGRALLRKSKILLIDEATASLDQVSEKNFYKRLTTHFPNATFIMICHKLTEVLQYCDRIVELQGDGKFIVTPAYAYSNAARAI